MSTPPRKIVVKEPIGAKNQRKLNFVPKDEELLTTKKLWEFNASQVPPPRKVVTKPFNWKTTNQEMANSIAASSRKSRKSKKSKKSRRTRKN